MEIIGRRLANGEEGIFRNSSPLGKTQSQLARLLDTSLKAIQSFEQGWRSIPVRIERQVLFLLASKKVVAQERKNLLADTKVSHGDQAILSCMVISGGKSLLVY